MSKYRRHSSGSKSEKESSDDNAITRKRVQQFNSEIKIERASDDNYYSNTALKKAHRHRKRH